MCAAVAESSPSEAAAPAHPAYAQIAAFFDAFAAEEPRWRLRNRTYHRLLEHILRFQVPRGATVLEVGSGSGDLLAALEPSVGVGIDVSAGMTRLARERHPELEFVQGAGEDVELGRPFDYIVLSDVVPFAHDLLALFENVARHSHAGTRVIVNSYSTLWRPVLAIAEWLRLKPRKPVRNWISPDDVRNLFELADFEVLATTQRILMPKQVPLLTSLLNGPIGGVWPFRRLCLTWWIAARPRPSAGREASVSVVCPCRNEQGHVAEILRRLPRLGTATEIVFVEGNSTDDTRAEIERQLAANPELDGRLLVQPGKGKADAVRTGFAAAKHDVLMILDGDLSVNPEDLPAFYRALVDGRGDVINGSRLVYDMEPGAMGLLNVFGNKLFSALFGGITGYRVKDTLCGTKVLFRKDYELIARGRSYFGEFDPFGDFDLLLGAARLNRKIIDLPVRYQARTYGNTNISRFRHGLLLTRMMLFAFWKFRIAIFRSA